VSAPLPAHGSIISSRRNAGPRGHGHRQDARHRPGECVSGA